MSGSAYYSAEAVASAISGLQGRFTANKNAKQSREDALGVSRLRNLQKKLENSEKDFYNLLGINRPDQLGKALQKFTNSINDIISNPVIKLCTSGSTTPFISYFRSNFISRANQFTAQEILDIFDLDGFANAYAEDHIDEFSASAAQTVKSMIERAAVDLVRGVANENRIAVQKQEYKKKNNVPLDEKYDKRRGYRKGTVASIIIRDEGTGKFTVNAEGVSPKTYLRFVEDIYEYFDKRKNDPNYANDPYVARASRIIDNRVGNFSSQNLRATISSAFYTYAKGMDSAMAAAISKALTNSAININNNDLVITGALGEAAALVALEEITKRYPKAKNVIPVGAILNTKKQQLSVDMVLKLAGKYFNFQVKNYILWGENKSYAFSRSYTVVGMAKSMQVPFLDAVVDLFGMYQFNQYREGKSNALDFGGTRAQIEGTVERTKEYFKTYVDRLLGIERQFQSIGGPSNLSRLGLHFNTFFMVSGHIVPSSVMVGALIDSVTAQSTEGISDIQITYTGPVGGSELSYPVVRPKEKHYDSGHVDGTVSLDDAADLISSKVRFVVNYGTLFSTALQRTGLTK